MLILGAYKYGEKILALYRANLDNIRSTVEKKEELVAQNGLDSGCGHCYRPRPWTGSESEYLQEEAEALLYAHSLFENICVHAMVDASDVKEDPAAQEGTSSSLLDRGWKDMCKVVEMQLSLMYDVLYTKASVIHACPGYCIRVLAPIFTATAFVLFELSDLDQGGRDLRADINYDHPCFAGRHLTPGDGVAVQGAGLIMGCIRLALQQASMELAPPCSLVHETMASASQCARIPWQPHYFCFKAERRIQEVVRQHGAVQPAALLQHPRRSRRPMQHAGQDVRRRGRGLVDQIPSLTDN